MKKILSLAVLTVMCFAAERASATDVLLHLSTSDPTQTSGTWTVTATLSDNQSLGIASFSIDVIGSSGVTAQKASGTSSDIPPTLLVPNPPYSINRTGGTLNAPNVTGITGAQDIRSAVYYVDPSFIRFGDGLLADAVSPVYHSTITHRGPLTLATGRWTASGTGGTIQAIVSPGSGINLFPLNFAVDDGTGGPPPAGSVQNVPFASNVVASRRLAGPARKVSKGWQASYARGSTVVYMKRVFSAKRSGTTNLRNVASFTAT
jgi:hypothetical protein